MPPPAEAVQLSRNEICAGQIEQVKVVTMLENCEPMPKPIADFEREAMEVQEPSSRSPYASCLSAETLPQKPLASVQSSSLVSLPHVEEAIRKSEGFALDGSLAERNHAPPMTCYGICPMRTRGQREWRLCCRMCVLELGHQARSVSASTMEHQLDAG